ncbi:MAG: aminotransferase class I/II-fold pyridoxal phosphate-dependent enzyme [Anaerolineaceae bacterium]|nr:aminotransferase class I/II-fold pyridoxal phosphate-dependent enzyme [Anaerolineaceae bacterium]
MEFKPADRIAHIKPYFFSDLVKKIEKLQSEGMDVIRLDMGSPDLPPAPFIIDSLIESVKKPNKHSYSSSGGSKSFLNAVSFYYSRRFNVDLDPETEVVALIGSKEGIFNIHHTMLNPGDLVLLPDPCYPVYRAGVSISNCQEYVMPLLLENGFLPNLESIPEDIVDKAKLMWVNYPNNPTGAIASLEFYEKLIQFAIKHKIIIAHDAPYVDVTYDGYIAPSILEVDGAREVVIEFNSLSKTYNMAGWRVGMAVGNPEIINLLKIYKSQIDTSLFTSIMDASETALMGDQSWLIERNTVYQERRDIIVWTLKEAGFRLDTPIAGLYIWCQLPHGFGDTAQFCEKLLECTGVSITPGFVYGPSGKDFIRISIVTPTRRIKEAMERMLTWMKVN